MEPNPNSFPILSYVLPRFHVGSSRGPHANEADLEQQQTLQRGTPAELELLTRMPRLTQPDLLASMAQAVSDVASARAVLRGLGPRPDREAVDAARARAAGSGADVEDDVERAAYEAVVRVEEMHASYEALLAEAERRLVGIYEDRTADPIEGGGEETDEEIIRILREFESLGRSVERVDLSSRGLRLIPEALGKLRCLLVLDLSQNQLEVIPDAIAGLENLQELRLSNNLLTSLPDSIGLLINLKILDASSNKLRSLPETISRCRSLVELDVSFNDLTYLPTKIGFELLDLQRLSISLNKIRSLPTSVCEMRSLRVLDARFNELRGLPNTIGKLTNLETLDLSGNFSDLTALPSSLGDLINLRELDLSNNQIRALPDTFPRLEKLEKLNLDGNPMVIPPADVVREGIEAVKEFMAKRWLEILEEEEKAVAAAMEASSSTSSSSEVHRGWLSLRAMWLGGVISDVAKTVTGYLPAADHSNRDPCLDQQF